MAKSFRFPVEWRKPEHIPFIQLHSFTNLPPPLISLATLSSFPPGEAKAAAPHGSPSWRPLQLAMQNQKHIPFIVGHSLSLALLGSSLKRGSQGGCAAAGAFHTFLCNSKKSTIDYRPLSWYNELTYHERGISMPEKENMAKRPLNVGLLARMCSKWVIK